MISHRETRVLPYTSRQIFNLVADAEKYPEFLPWCSGVRITRRFDKGFEADVLVGTKRFRETFATTVTLSEPDRIDTKYLHGPFKHLHSVWKFSPAPEGGCLVNFFIEFEFRSKLLQHLMGAFFHEASHRMVSAFEARAHVLYSSSGVSQS